jgi:hypothetical protein
MYVASLVLTVLALLAPVVGFTEPDGAVAEMTNFKYTAADGEVSRSVIALGILLVFTAVVNLLGLLVSLYNNFEMQKRVTILSMLLFAGYYILFFVYTLILSGGTSMAIEVPMLYPFMALTLNLFAYLLLRRCEAKIIAKALGFRLRD